MLHPKTIGNAIFMSIAPAVARPTKIPVVADELCKTAVITAPAKIPIGQLSPIVNKTSLKTSELVRGFIEELIIPIPVNNIPKPSIIFPISFLFFPFANITIAAPIKTKSGAISSSLNATSCAVIVVPILAPIIIPTA